MFGAGSLVLALFSDWIKTIGNSTDLRKTVRDSRLNASKYFGEQSGDRPTYHHIALPAQQDLLELKALLCPWFDSLCHSVITKS